MGEAGEGVTPAAVENPVLRLKTLCAAHGIYTFASLAAFIEVAPGRTQAEVASRSQQSKSSVGQWMDLYELHELIVRTGRGKGHVKVAITERGEALKAAAIAPVQDALSAARTSCITDKNSGNRALDSLS